MGAGHSHGRPSGHAGGRYRARLGGAFALTAVFFGVELVAGLVSGSLALLSDAGHMGADVVALVEAAPAIGGVSGSVAAQLAGVAGTLVYSGLVTAAILWVVDRVVGLRVSAQAERDGLDLSQHGERVE